MDNSNCQYDIHCIVKLHNYGGLANMECKHLNLWLLCGCYCCCRIDDIATTSAHPLLLLDKWFVSICLNVNFDIWNTQSNLCQTRVFCISILQATFYHILLIYMYINKGSNQIRVIYLGVIIWGNVA